MGDLVSVGILGILTIIFIVITISLIVLTIVFGIIRVVKKKFKKTFVTLLIVMILFGVVDFFMISNLIDNFNQMGKQETDKVILSDNPIKQLFMSDEEKIEIISDNIIKSIKTKDYETIKNIFSKDTIENVQNLDEGINELINISNEGIINVESKMNGSETHWDNGEHRKTYRFSCNLTTNTKEYSIGFIYDYENPFNNKTLGINRMIIIDENKNTIVLIENSNEN